MADQLDDECKCSCRLFGVLKAQPVSCSGPLKELSSKLSGQVQDEKDATQMYADFAQILRKHDMPVWAATLDSMSRDEEAHGKMLEEIVSVIAENCAD